MRLFQCLALLFLAILFLVSCSPKQESKPITFEGLVDKKILPIHDSVNTTKDKNIRLGFFPLLHRLAKAYPYSKDSASHAMLNLDLGINYASVGFTDSAMLYASEALPYFESHPEFQYPLMRSYQILGMALRNNRGNIFLANRYSSKAAALSQLPGMDSLCPIARRVQLLFVASNTNMACEQMNEGLRFAQAACQLMMQAPDSINSFVRYRALFELSAAYLEVKQFDSAQKYIGAIEHFVANTKITDGESGLNSLKSTYYQDIQQYDSALKYMLTITNFDSFAGAYNKLNMYTILHKPAEAARYFQVAEALAHVDTARDNGSNDYYKCRTQYLILYGNRQDAWRSFLTFDSLSRAKYSRDRLEMYASIEPEYNLADKQKRLDRLGKANQAAQDEIRRKNTLLLLSILAVLLVTVIIIAVLLFSRQRKLRSEKKVLETERNKIELEQRLLRTQMEPHFIFNTLSVLQSQIHNHENEKAGVYLNHFARLLRTSLENSRENFVPLQEEIEALNAYLSLQQMRFENKFDYTLQLYPGFEDDDVQILPMLLQPFVENAIQYGQTQNNERLRISVDIEKKADVVYCIIEDTGGGIITQGKNIKKKSLSTQIIRERLAIVSRQTGKEADLIIQHTELQDKGGTRVTILFPSLTEVLAGQLG